MNLSVVEMVAAMLRLHGYDGLYYDFGMDGEEMCGCPLSHLAPCGEMNHECRGGYFVGDGIGPEKEAG